MTPEQDAFFRRLSLHPRGSTGLNERFSKDAFIMSVCSVLKPWFTGDREAPRPPVSPQREALP